MAHFTFGKPCEQCGKAFYASRIDAKYCSANCRQRAARRKTSVNRTATNILTDVNFLKSQMEQYPDLAVLVNHWLSAIALSVTAAVVTGVEIEVINES